MLRLDPEECSEPVVRALIDAYRRSRHGRTGAGQRDYHLLYDKLVHKLAHATVSQEKRGRLVLDRLRAAGLIRWDHVRLQRNEIKTIYIAQASEKDFFLAVGAVPPSVMRGNTTDILAKHLDALTGHTHEAEWRAVLKQAIYDIENGYSADGLPNDAGLHDEILTATAAVLNNRHRIRIRKLSAQKLPNSKVLGERQDTVERFMTQFLPPDLATLEAWQVIKNPPTVLMRGPLGLEMDDGKTVDELPSDSPYRIKEERLVHAASAFTSAKRCLSIENETTFYEMVEVNVDDLIVHTSYPSGLVVKLLRLLPKSVRLEHWGDTDPHGYDVLRVLREKTGRTIYPWRMRYRPGPGKPLTGRERAVISRLLADSNVSDLHEELNAMRVAGTKGKFEQESLPIIELQED